MALSLIPQYALVRWAAHCPEFVERYYSEGLYPIISKAFRFALGWLPFSFGDLVYALAIVFIVRWLYLNAKRLFKDTWRFLMDITAALAVVYFAFHICWGLNYYRLPLHEHLKLDNNYTTEQLVKVTEKLIEAANETHLAITHNDTQKVAIPYSKSEILNMAANGYPDFDYTPKSIKKSLFSYPLTYMGFSGYLNPLTNEAQVNSRVPAFRTPTTTLHEIAHQLGYAAENEANFLACLAAINHDDIYFRYAGYTFGLHYCLNEIYKRDKPLYEQLTATINKGILKNYQDIREFWQAHQNPAEPFFKLFYGNYLKANKQTKGLESYNYVVALLVNYFEARP
ncbi:MAG: DUF3810 domain-containing protein [Flavobacteriaceae bacterium]